MNAKKCDRCGKFYTENVKIPDAKIGGMDEGDILTRVSILYDKCDGRRPCPDTCYLDLCEHCMQEFVSFWNTVVCEELG